MVNGFKATNDEFPFGELHGGTLIVCLSTTHRRNVADAFRKPGRYVIPGTQLGSETYQSIIIFTPQVSQEKAIDLDRFKNWIDQHVLLKLSPNDGKAYYV